MDQTFYYDSYLFLVTLHFFLLPSVKQTMLEGLSAPRLAAEGFSFSTVDSADSALLHAASLFPCGLPPARAEIGVTHTQPQHTAEGPLLLFITLTRPFFDFPVTHAYLPCGLFIQRERDRETETARECRGIVWSWTNAIIRQRENGDFTQMPRD